MNLSGVTEVTVAISFPELETKTLSVSRDKIQVSGLPAGMTYTIGTQICTITVRGPKAQVDAMTEEHLTVRVNLADAQLGEDLFPAQVYVDGAFPGVGVLGPNNISILVRGL